MANESPQISILMPCLNEEKYIKDSIESLIDEYVLKNSEILVVDGGSEDKTLQIVDELVLRGYPIRIFENDNKLQSYGLNLGIKESRGTVIVRADAHCVFPEHYVKQCVELLEMTEADNVGGVMAPKGEAFIQKSIAIAMQHPVGVGNAKFHLGRSSGYVDTVYLGTFKKSLFKEVGYFDFKAKTNEDAELNLRILRTGGKIYLDKDIKVIYFPRKTLRDLLVQYFRYGRGRAYTTLKHKRFTSWRQVLPVLFVLSMIISPLLPLITKTLFGIPSTFGLVLFIFYLIVLFFVSIFMKVSRLIDYKYRIFIPIVFMVMHIGWGFGFLSRLVWK